MTPQVEAFLEMMAVERDASPHTLSAYGRDLADAETWLSDAGGLMGASQEAVEAWFADLSRRGLSAATAARRRSSVRQFYRFALGEGWRTDDPSRRIDAPNPDAPASSTALPPLPEPAPRRGWHRGPARPQGASSWFRPDAIDEVAENRGLFR